MMNSLEDETRSILFSSHNTLDVEQISDYISFIYAGCIIESCNKEDFMDGWRRIRLTHGHDGALPDLPNIRDVQQSGRLCTVTVNAYQDAIADQFRHAGMQVDAIERLTLEEIFLSYVSHAQAMIRKEARL